MITTRCISFIRSRHRSAFTVSCQLGWTTCVHHRDVFFVFLPMNTTALCPKVWSFSTYRKKKCFVITCNYVKYNCRNKTLTKIDASSQTCEEVLFFFWFFNQLSSFALNFSSFFASLCLVGCSVLHALQVFVATPITSLQLMQSLVVDPRGMLTCEY